DRGGPRGHPRLGPRERGHGRGAHRHDGPHRRRRADLAPDGRARDLPGRALRYRDRRRRVRRGELPLDRHHCPARGEQARVTARPPASLDELLDAAVGEHGDRTALIDGELQLTYAELAARAAALAAALVEAGVAKGDRVGIYLDKNWQ